MIRALCLLFLSLLAWQQVNAAFSLHGPRRSLLQDTGALTGTSTGPIVDTLSSSSAVIVDSSTALTGVTGPLDSSTGVTAPISSTNDFSSTVIPSSTGGDLSSTALSSSGDIVTGGSTGFVPSSSTGDILSSSGLSSTAGEVSSSTGSTPQTDNETTNYVTIINAVGSDVLGTSLGRLGFYETPNVTVQRKAQIDYATQTFSGMLSQWARTHRQEAKDWRMWVNQQYTGNHGYFIDTRKVMNCPASPGYTLSSSSSSSTGAVISSSSLSSPIVDSSSSTGDMLSSTAGDLSSSTAGDLSSSTGSPAFTSSTATVVTGTTTVVTTVETSTTIATGTVDTTGGASGAARRLLQTQNNQGADGVTGGTDTGNVDGQLDSSSGAVVDSSSGALVSSSTGATPDNGTTPYVPAMDHTLGREIMRLQDQGYSVSEIITMLKTYNLSQVQDCYTNYYCDNGYSIYGYNSMGFDRYGYDADGYDAQGWSRENSGADGTQYNRLGQIKGDTTGQHVLFNGRGDVLRDSSGHILVYSFDGFDQTGMDLYGNPRSICPSENTTEPAPISASSDPMAGWLLSCDSGSELVDDDGTVIYLRKSANDMTATEWNAFRSAWNTLWDRGTIQHIISIAAQDFNQHNSVNFLPWHREALARFEDELHRAAPCVFLPYWDVIADRTFPLGIASTTTPLVFPPGDVKRSLGTAGLLPNGASLDYVLQATDFATFSTRLEQFHNAIHVYVGGDMNVLATAPKDPVYFLLHAYIDHIWDMWMLEHPDVDTSSVGTLSFAADGSDDVQFSDLTNTQNVQTVGGKGYVYI